MKKILLLGCSGFIGSAIFEALREYTQNDVLLFGTYFQHHPVAAPLSPVAASLSKFSLHPLDVTKSMELKQLLHAVQPEVIINTVAISTIDACEMDKKRCDNINVDPTRTIVEYCKHKPAVKYIFFSSDHVFDGRKQEPYTEKDPTGPANYYGATKLQCETLIRSELANYVILRLCFVFGVPKPYHHPNLFSTIYDAIKKQKIFSAYNDKIRSPCYIQDIPKVVELTIKKNKKGLFLVGGNTMTVYEFAIAIAKYFNLDQTMIKETASAGNEAVPRPQNCSLNVAFTEKSFGIKFRSALEAFKEIKEVL